MRSRDQQDAAGKLARLFTDMLLQPPQDLILQYITHLYVASLALAQQQIGLSRISTANPMRHTASTQPATPQVSMSRTVVSTTPYTWQISRQLAVQLSVKPGHHACT
jgi:hypothetical protein